MAIYLDTRGHTTLAVGICGRCSVKYPLDELTPDPNSPGLLVCPDGCKDEFDPYRLPARAPDRITVENPRPDVPLSPDGPIALFGTNVLDPEVYGQKVLDSPVSVMRPPRPWQPNTWYEKGDTITPQSVNSDTVPLPQQWIVCLVSGLSGDTPPDFPVQTGVLKREQVG